MHAKDRSTTVELLHELAEGLQGAATYLEAFRARAVSEGSNCQLLEKSANEIERASRACKELYCCLL